MLGLTWATFLLAAVTGCAPFKSRPVFQFDAGVWTVRRED